VDIVDSIIDPATADSAKTYCIAFEDDDWDHWTGIEQAATYRGWRRDGRWWFSALEGGERGDWDYADDEIIVLGELEALPPAQ
jgi:hypothetical protein